MNETVRLNLINSLKDLIEKFRFGKKTPILSMSSLKSSTIVDRAAF